MIQAHIDQLHEAVGSTPNMRFGSTGNNGGGGGHGDGGPPGLGYRNTDGNAGGLGRAPVPAAAGGPNPPDPPDDDGDEDDEEEPSDDDDDDRRRTEDHHEEGGRGMTVVDQGYHGRRLRKSTYLHGRRSRSWTAGRWHSP